MDDYCRVFVLSCDYGIHKKFPLAGTLTVVNTVVGFQPGVLEILTAHTSPSKKFRVDYGTSRKRASLPAFWRLVVLSNPDG